MPFPGKYVDAGMKLRHKCRQEKYFGTPRSTTKQKSEEFAMKYIEEIESRKAELSAIIKKALAQLKNAPEGQLRIKIDGNKPRFYCRKSSRDSNGSYLSCKGESSELVRKLAQKKYVEKVLRSAEDELAALEHGEGYIIDHMPTIKADEVYDSIAPVVRALATPIIVTDEQFIGQWQNRKYEYFDYYEEEKKFTTKRGEKVRSKSERMIADILFDEGIPYKYECPLIVGGHTLHPDFTILDIRSRKEIYWEHFGMVDNEKYAINAFKRIYGYCAAGTAGMGNLIITCEADKIMPFDAPDVLSILVDRGLIPPERLISRKAS